MFSALVLSLKEKKIIVPKYLWYRLKLAVEFNYYDKYYSYNLENAMNPYKKNAVMFSAIMDGNLDLVKLCEYEMLFKSGHDWFLYAIKSKHKHIIEYAFKKWKPKFNEKIFDMVIYYNADVNLFLNDKDISNSIASIFRYDNLEWLMALDKNNIYNFDWNILTHYTNSLKYPKCTEYILNKNKSDYYKILSKYFEKFYLKLINLCTVEELNKLLLRNIESINNIEILIKYGANNINEAILHSLNCECYKTTKYLLELPNNIDINIIEDKLQNYTVKNNFLELLIYLKDSKNIDIDKFEKKLVKSGDDSVLKYVMENMKCNYSEKIAKEICKYLNYELLDIYIKKYDIKHIAYYMIEYHRTNMIEKIKHINGAIYLVQKYSAIKGNISSFKYLVENGYTIPQKIYKKIIINNNSTCIDYFMSLGMEFPYIDICKYISKLYGGTVLTILKNITNHNYEKIARKCIKKNYMKVIKYLKKNNKVKKDKLMYYAELYNNIDCIEILKN